MESSEKAPMSPNKDDRRGRLKVMFTDWPTVCWKNHLSTGFYNKTGVLCFRNVIVVALLHAPAFLQWLSAHVGVGCEERARTGECIACLLADLSTEYWTEVKADTERKINAAMSKFWKCCRQRFWKHRHDEEQDADEFLVSLITHLSDQFERSQVDDLGFKHIFQTVLKVYNKCEKCGVLFEPSKDCDYSLRITPLDTQSTTIYDALDVAMTGRHPQRTCIHCKHVGPTTQYTYIRDAPEILIIRINRNQLLGEPSGDTKVTSKVEYEEIIDLTEKLESYAREAGEKLAYRLHSATFHEGETTTSGHYFTIARTPESNWTYISDDFSEPSSLQAALGKEAVSANADSYVLFYARDPYQSWDTESRFITESSMFPNESMMVSTTPPQRLETIQEEALKPIEDDSLFFEKPPKMAPNSPPKLTTIQEEAQETVEEAEPVIESSIELLNPDDDLDFEVSKSPAMHAQVTKPCLTRWEGQPAKIEVKVTLGDFCLTGVLKGVMQRTVNLSTGKGLIPPETPTGVKKRARRSKKASRRSSGNSQAVSKAAV